MKKEMTMRAKFNEDSVDKVAEPRFCYKMVSGNLNVISDQTLRLVSPEEPYLKKLAVENNFNFLYDFIRILLNPF